MSSTIQNYLVYEEPGNLNSRGKKTTDISVEMTQVLELSEKDIKQLL